MFLERGVCTVGILVSFASSCKHTHSTLNLRFMQAARAHACLKIAIGL
jgi:hypothetical protein